MKVFTLFLALLVTGCSIREVYIRDGVPHAVPRPHADSIRHSLFLIGDAGLPDAQVPEATLQLLSAMASAQPERSTIVFLGDNIYTKGLPVSGDPERKEMERRLNEQIAVGTTSGARTIFVPGNHDWEYQREGGYAAILREGEYLRTAAPAHVTLLPEHGLPGPHTVMPDSALRLIAIDTQWWLHAYDKPFYPGDTAAAQTQRRFLDSLSAMLTASRDIPTIVIAHHPLITYGEHGGFFDWQDHLFPLRKLNTSLWVPLPVIGSLYPVSRMLGISDQDLSGRGNRAMVRALDSVLSTAPPLAYAAGHEHTLQILRMGSGVIHIVSGNGIAKHDEALSTGAETLLASTDKGFIRVDVLTDGSVRAGVIAVRKDAPEGTEIFSMMLR